jgi:hypothetical protein
MISPAADEIVATLQCLGRSRRAGRFWTTFWKGEAAGGSSAPLASSLANAGADGRASRGGSWIAAALGLSTVTPTLVLSALLGVWLMFSPVALGSTGAAAVNDQLLGPLVITVSVIALAEVGRSARWLNVPLGLWLIAAPWWLDGAAAAARWNDAGAGALLILLSVPRGRIEEKYGGFERYLV